MFLYLKTALLGSMDYMAKQNNAISKSSLLDQSGAPFVLVYPFGVTATIQASHRLVSQFFLVEMFFLFLFSFCGLSRPPLHFPSNSTTETGKLESKSHSFPPLLKPTIESNCLIFMYLVT